MFAFTGSPRLHACPSTTHHFSNADETYLRKNIEYILHMLTRITN